MKIKTSELTGAAKNEHDANVALHDAALRYVRTAPLSLADRRACESMRRWRQFKARLVTGTYWIVCLGSFAVVGVMLAWRG